MNQRRVQNQELPVDLEPWDFSLIPNYHRALPVETVQAESLSVAEFYRKQVSMNRPCLIKGAARHWPAVAQWASIPYLKSKTADDVIQARQAPDSEFSQEEQSRTEMRFAEFLDRASENPEQLVVHSIPLRQGQALHGLLNDIGQYHFLGDSRPPRMYPLIRAFFYRNSYTDWHYHPSDETLMTQVVGSKEVLLFAPDDQTWDALNPVIEKQDALYGIDLAEFPKVGELQPYRIIVEAGDALYIPAYWWHAVTSIDNQFGVTIARAFGTPLHVAGDLRYPINRKIIRHLLKTRMFPLALLAVSYAYMRRAMSMLMRS